MIPLFRSSLKHTDQDVAALCPYVALALALALALLLPCSCLALVFVPLFSLESLRL